ncbi:O-antigen ligase family protein [Phascolarctobacterium succinatutens]
MSIKVHNLLEIIMWLITAFLLVSFTIFDNTKYISLIIAGITVILLLLDSISNNFRILIKLSGFHLWGFGFAGYCLLSSLWAINPENSFSKGITIIQIIICMTVIYSHYYRNYQPHRLLSIAEYSGYMIALYYIYFWGLGYIRNSLMAGSRIENAFANGNTIGMSCAISFIISVYFLLYVSKKHIIKFPFMALLLTIVAATASRKALVIVVLGVLFLFLFKYKSKDILKTFFRWLFISGTLIALFLLILSFPIFDGLNHRMEGLIAAIIGHGSIDNSTYLRQQFIKIGLEQFLETPLVGIGIDNARLLLLQHFGYTTYLHNNYVELLASGGIVGAGIFYSIYIYTIYKLKVNWRHYNSERILILLLILMQLAMDFGAVSYYSKNAYFYIMMFFLFIKYNNRGKVS